MAHYNQESPSWGTKTLSVIREIPECYETESSLPCSKQFATDPIISQTNTIHHSQHIFKLNLILSPYQRLGLLKESEKTVAGNVWSQEIYLRILHKTIATKCVLYLDMSGLVDYISRAEGHEQAGIRTLFTREENTFFLMFCSPCIVIYPYIKNQQDALFTFNLFR